VATVYLAEKLEHYRNLGLNVFAFHGPSSGTCYWTICGPGCFFVMWNSVDLQK
jgi:hypothetical protein